MFQVSTLKAASLVAIILSSLGLLVTLGAAFLLDIQFVTLQLFIGSASWILLLWASIIGYQLCSSYTLYEDEYKKVGIMIYAIILSFVLFFFVGIVVGLIISTIILATLWGLKKNYDEWEYTNSTAESTHIPSLEKELDEEITSLNS